MLAILLTQLPMFASLFAQFGRGMGFFFDPMYLLFLGPAMLMGLWAQWRVRSTYAQAGQYAASLSGAAAAHYILDSAGLAGSVAIEPTPGQLSDHYDPKSRVLRLSHDVYHGRSLAAVGIAAHEAGHALQHAKNYAPLVIRNLAVPAANFGGGFSMILLMIGIMSPALRFLGWAGVIAYSAVAFFQLVNLPVEFDASRRAKAQLVQLGIVPEQELFYVRKMLNAAALTYVAGTLQTILTLLYFILRLTGGRRDDR